MIKFLLDVLQLAIALRLIYWALRWLKKGKKKSIAYKLYRLVTNKIHRKLDAMLAKQEAATKQPAKIVPFRKVR